MKVKPIDVVTSARKLIGTPYQHQGRLPGIACDCIGLAILVCRDLGLGDFDFNAYSRSPDGSLVREIEKVCTPLAKVTEGSLVIFAMRKFPQHCAIASLSETKDFNIIHAYQNSKAVREHQLIPWWQEKIHSVYALPNIDYSGAKEFSCPII